MERADITPELEQRIVRDLGRHVVAIAGTYRLIDEQGKTENEDRFFAIAVCIFAVADKWFLITAGHCVDEYRELAKSQRAVITGRVLVDYFGTGAQHHYPIPYDLESEECSHLDVDGVDFAVIQVSPLLRQQLEANGNIPLTPASWAKPDDRPFDSFFVYGFPAERTDALEIAGRPGGIIQADLMPVRRLGDDKSHRFPRFRAEIVDRGDLASVKGFSGGPVLGMISGEEQTQYYVVAIQSSWDKVQVIFGCPIYVIVDVMMENFRLSQEGGAG